MPRKADERIEQAKEMFLQGKKLVEIASQLNLPEGTVRRWKCTHKWDNERSDKPQGERSGKKKGGQLGNKNASGHGGTGPPGNKNAEKHGFFSRYFPEETVSIICEIEKKNPLDIIWENIQIAYAAIVRAQQIMYVRDKKDKTKEKVEYKDGNVIGEKWEVQQAWDKQAGFLKAQARAQAELRSLIKQYDEMCHKNWKLVTEEQKSRIDKIRAETEQLRNASSGKEEGEVYDWIRSVTGENQEQGSNG